MVNSRPDMLDFKSRMKVVFQKHIKYFKGIK